MGESSYLQETSIRRPELLFYRETIWKRDFFLGWIAKEIAFQLWPRHIGMALTLLTVSVVAYVLLLAIPSLLRHRYFVIAALFNLPGNALIGGGGGDRAHLRDETAVLLPGVPVRRMPGDLSRADPFPVSEGIAVRDLQRSFPRTYQMLRMSYGS